MASIRMSDGTLITGVPDDISKDQLDALLIAKHGQGGFDAMTGANKREQPRVDAPVEPVAEPVEPVDKHKEAMQSLLEHGERGAKFARERELSQPDTAYYMPDPKRNAIHDVGRRMKDMIDSGDYSPDDLGLSQKTFDYLKAPIKEKKTAAQDQSAYEALLTEDPELAAQRYPHLAEPAASNEPMSEEAKDWVAYVAMLAENPELASHLYPDISKPTTAKEKKNQAAYEKAIAEGRPTGAGAWGNLLKSVFTDGFKTIFQGEQLRYDATARVMAENEDIGAQILVNAMAQYPELDSQAKELLKLSAIRRDMSIEELMVDVADVAASAIEQEGGTYKELLLTAQKIQMAVPAVTEKNWMARDAANLIQATPQAAYVIASVYILKNPAMMIPMFAWDIHGREYGSRRLQGRSHEQAEMDTVVTLFIETITEMIPSTHLFNALKRVRKGAPKAAAFAEVGLVNLVQEVGAEALIIAYDTNVINESMSWGQIAQALRDAGVVGLGVGVMVSAPAIAVTDVEMGNIDDRITKAKQGLQSVVNRMNNPTETGEAVSKEEKEAAIKGFADAVNEKRALVQKREEAEETKKKAKVDKKEVTRKAKRTPIEVKREAAIDKAGKTDQAVDKLTPEIEAEAEALAKVIAHEEIGEKDVQGLLDKGLVKVTKTGTLVALPAANSRLKAVRAAQEKAAQVEKPVKPRVRMRPKTKQKKAKKGSTDMQAVLRERTKAQKIRAQAKEKKQVAKNLTDLDEHTGTETKLGKVLREAEKRLKADGDKALAQIKKDFSTPIKGDVFDLGGALARGGKEYATLVKYGAFRLAQHGAKYSAWAADMVAEFGENIKPVLKRLYNDAKRNAKNVMKWSHERFGSGTRKGELKHAPKKYAKRGAIAGLRRVLGKLASEGKTARMWYEKSGSAINKAAGNATEARLLSGILAIYSTGTGVGPNLTNALKMWAIYQSGNIPKTGAGTMAGRFSRQDLEAIRWLKGQTDEAFMESAGEKVFPFFTNLMRQVDPETYEYGQGVTVDLWMMRAFGYDVAAPSSSQGAFAAVELRALAEKLGWEKQQVQAAIWVSIKSRWSVIIDKAKKIAVKRGLAEFNLSKNNREVFDVLGSTRDEQIANEKKITMIFREEALKISVGELEASLNRSKKDFSDFLEAQYATVSWESEPSAKLGLVFNSMPIEDKVLLQYEISQVLTNPETGREYIAEWLGLLGADQFQGPGAWDGAVGEATQNQVLAPLQHKRSEAKHTIKTVQPQSASALDGYSAILGFLLRQDAVAWHRPFYGNAKKRANGVSIVMQRDMGAAKLRRAVVKLYSAIIAESVSQGFGEEVGLNWAPIVLNGEIRVLNFEGDFVGNRVFHKVIKAAIEKSGVGGATEVFQSDGNIIGNNWDTNPNGESYETAINASKNKRVVKAFERAKRELAGRIDAVYEKYAEKYAAGRRAEVRVTRLEEGQKAPKLKKGRMRFRHFSDKVVGALKVEFFGTGIKGAEKARGSMQVISAYPDKGFKKEVGLGQVEYVIDVAQEDLYDANNDPSGFKAKATVATGTQGGKPIGGRLDINKFERLVKGAGFVGYYTPKADGNLRGQARFFHDLTVGRDTLSATLMMPSKPTIEIVENASDQLEVRDTDGKVHYIEDPDDAIDKARDIYGDDLIVKIVDEAGDVIVTDYPDPKRMTLQEKLEEKSALGDIYVAVNEFMEEFTEETTEHPISAMRILGAGPSIEVSPRGGGIWIDAIRAYDKGEGQGNEALQFLIELADKHGVQMRLYAKPFGEVVMDEQALIRWYEKNGFVRTVAGSTTMVRMPQNVTSTFSMWRRPTTLTNAFWGIEVAEAQAIVDEFKIEMGIENIVVLESVEGLPDDVYVQIVMRGYAASVQGVFHDDAKRGPTIYVIANNITHIEGANGLIEVLLHETMGHFGLQALLGVKKYNQIMDAIIKAFPEKVDEQSENKGKGLQARRLAAEEVFAYTAQSELLGQDLTNTQRGFIQRVIAEIRLLFIRLGWKKMTDEAMLDLIRQSLRFVRNNNTATLQKRSKKVSDMRAAAIKAEEGEITTTLSLTEDERTFHAVVGLSKKKAFEGLRNWRFSNLQGISQRLEIFSLDEFSGIRHMEQEIGIEGTISAFLSVHLAAGTDTAIQSAMQNGAPKWVYEADGSFSAGTVEGSKGLEEVLVDIDSPTLWNNFQAWLVANRSRRLIKEGKEHLVNRKQIAAVLNGTRKRGEYKLFVKTQRELDTFKTQVLNFAQDSGLIDPVSRKLWEKHDHIPFYRVLAQNSDKGAFAKLGSVGKVIHRLKGSTAALEPALDSVFLNISMLIEASIKNKTTAAVINQFKDSGVVTKVPRTIIDYAMIPMDQIKKMLEEAGVNLGEVGEEMLSGVQRLMSVRERKEGDNVVSVQVEGKKEFYYVNDAGVMAGMDNIGSPMLDNKFMGAFRVPKRLFTGFITRFTEFIMSNWWRDIWVSWGLSRYGNLTPIASSARGFFKAYKSQSIKEMQAGGGMFEFGYINANDPSKVAAAMRKKLIKRGRANILDTPRKLWDVYKQITNMAENAARVAIFDKTLKKTGSRKQALYEARDIMDFSMRGSSVILKFFIETVPFMGAAIQGNYRGYRGLQGRAGIPRLVLSRGMLYSMMSVINHLMNRDDERYKALLPWEKRMYYHFYDVSENLQHIRLPIPFEWGAVFTSIPILMVEALLSEEPDKGKTLAGDLWWVLMEQVRLNPTPQAVLPLIELWLNKNMFTGQRIVNQWEQDLDASRQFGDSTSRTAIWLAKQWPEGAPDWARSPKKTQHLIKGYLASLGNYLLIISDTLFFGENRPTLRKDEYLPAVSRFIREDYPKYSIWEQNLYENWSEARKRWFTIQDILKEETDEADEEAERLEDRDSDWLTAYEDYKPVIKELQTINREMHAIRTDTDMTPDEKRKELDELYMEKLEVTKDIYPYRPGGPEDKGKSDPIISRESQQWLKDLIGKTKREQVDILIGAGLPHAATLINDVTIGPTKLKAAA